MTLVLDGVSKIVGATVHVHPTDLVLQKGTMNVLLGPTLSGKTTMMRLMAGLDAPTTGRILWNDTDVTGMRVQDRKVAMVYQQFINYPSMSVYDNIASPMRLMGESKVRDRPGRARHGRDDEADAVPRPQAAGAFGRSAAALCPRAGAGEECRSGAARRAAGQSRLQAARGIARRDPAHLRGIGLDLRLCHHRTRGSAASRRQHRDPLGGPDHPVRSDAGCLPQAEGRDDGAGVQRSADELPADHEDRERDRLRGRPAGGGPGHARGPARRPLSGGVPPEPSRAGETRARRVGVRDPARGDRDHGLGDLRASRPSRPTLGRPGSRRPGSAPPGASRWSISIRHMSTCLPRTDRLSPSHPTQRPPDPWPASPSTILPIPT